MDNKVVIRPNFLITTFLRLNMPLEVEIGRNFYRFTSKKSYYNGVCIVKYKELGLCAIETAQSKMADTFTEEPR